MQENSITLSKVAPITKKGWGAGFLLGLGLLMGGAGFLLGRFACITHLPQYAHWIGIAVGAFWGGGVFFMADSGDSIGMIVLRPLQLVFRILWGSVVVPFTVIGALAQLFRDFAFLGVLIIFVAVFWGREWTETTAPAATKMIKKTVQELQSKLVPTQPKENRLAGKIKENIKQVPAKAGRMAGAGATFIALKLIDLLINPVTILAAFGVYYFKWGRGAALLPSVFPRF